MPFCDAVLLLELLSESASDGAAVDMLVVGTQLAIVDEALAAD